jgi:hypothetical protein
VMEKGWGHPLIINKVDVYGARLRSVKTISSSGEKFSRPGQHVTLMIWCMPHTKVFINHQALMLMVRKK